MWRAQDKSAFDASMQKQYGDKSTAVIKALPNFKNAYQGWYSEAKTMIRQLLPDRIEDFSRLYEKPKSRKEITYENYCIEDCLQGLIITRNVGINKETVVGPEAGIPRIEQQVAIVESAKIRFESSLF
jgi:hypothetical protein